MTRPPETAWAELAEEYTNAATEDVADAMDPQLATLNAVLSLALSAREVVYELRGIREALEGIEQQGPS